MNKTLGILFFIRREKSNHQTGESPIYLRLTVDGQRVEMSINRSINQKKWNPKAGKASGTNNRSKELNAYIDSLRSDIYEHHRKLLINNKPITAKDLKNSILGIEQKCKTLVQVIDDHNSQMKSLIGKDYSIRTLKRYETTLTHVKAFIKWKYNLNDINIKLFDFQFVLDMEFYLKTEKNISNNAAVKYMCNLKKIIRIAYANDWIEKDPFIRYKGKIKDNEKYFLNSEELITLLSKKLTIDRIDKVRDIFVFSCYTGLAYVDVSKLKSEHITKGIDGEDWITLNRTKTNVQCKIPILPEAKRILDKYKNDIQCLNSGKILPVLSNQKMNSYLKEIADLCGFTKNLTFHIARHTFATTVTLSNNVPLESVSKMMGHTNTIMTQRYAKILDKKLYNDIAPLRDLLKISNK